jgi:hypothetical protein
MRKIKRQIELNAKQNQKAKALVQESPSTEAPELLGLSAKLERDLRAFIDEDEGIDEEILTEDLIQALDGQPVSTLESILDYLRHYGKYQISTQLLEEAWHSDLPLSFMGRIAQDWVGTVKFGLNDHLGAEIVSQYLVKKALTLGPSFCHELCDLFLEWKLYPAAIPLGKEAIKGLSGDMAVQYHFGVISKLEMQWETARLAFEKVLKQSQHSSVYWNLGIIAVAQRNWVKAREYWKKVGLLIEDGEGDYAAMGNLTPIRLPLLKIKDDEMIGAQEEEKRQTLAVQNLKSQYKSEVVWGMRLCPARIEITSIPYYHQDYSCGDVVLVDGAQNGEINLQNQKYPIMDVIGKFSESKGETLKLYAEMNHPKQAVILDQQVEKMSQMGWQIVNWTRLEKNGKLCIALYISSKQNKMMAQQAIDQYLEGRFKI